MTSWTKENIDLLIDLYQENAILYNTSLKDYHNKNKRDLAIKGIAEILEISDEESVKKKINGLRTQYASERVKELTSQKSGAGLDDVYVSKWVHFQKLTFLQEHITPRRTLTNLQPDIFSEEENTDDTITVGESDSSVGKGKKNAGRKRSIREEEDNVLREAMHSLKSFKQQSQVTSEDENDSFAKYIASQLKAIKNPETVRYAQMKVHNLLYEIMSSENQSRTTTPSASQTSLYPGQTMRLPPSGLQTDASTAFSEYTPQRPFQHFQNRFTVNRGNSASPSPQNVDSNRSNFSV